jgi:hypothetical protein
MKHTVYLSVVRAVWFDKVLFVKCTVSLIGSFAVIANIHLMLIASLSWLASLRPTTISPLYKRTGTTNVNKTILITGG